MAHDVFLSYSNKDKAAADAVCHALERNRIRVWMAPRDILAGVGWAQSIIGAINGARVMVLVFSGNANGSPQIEREVERAVNKGVPVIPVRIEDVAPSEALEYFISAPHWLDAFAPPFEQHVDRVADAVKRLLESEFVRKAVPRETEVAQQAEEERREREKAEAGRREALETAQRAEEESRRQAEAEEERRRNDAARLAVEEEAARKAEEERRDPGDEARQGETEPPEMKDSAATRIAEIEPLLASSQPPKKSSWIGIAAALAVIAAIGGGVLFTGRGDSPVSGQDAPQAVVIASAPATETQQTEFDDAMAAATVEALDAFVNKNPKSPLAKTAQREREKLARQKREETKRESEQTTAEVTKLSAVQEPADKGKSQERKEVPPAITSGPCGGTVLASLSSRAAVPLSPGEECALKPKNVFKECPECPEMVVVPAGSFTMGSPKTEPERNDDEGPQHKVTISKRLAVGRFTVTFAEWDACVADGGCNGYRLDDRAWGRGRMPVINVSWNDAQAYLSWLSKKTGKTYRLLSEAEWEYSARAGTTTPFWQGATISTDQANYNGRYFYPGGKKGEFRGKTVPVDMFAPNAFGLYNVHGNVLQWCADAKRTYTAAPMTDPLGPTENVAIRVQRGGGLAYAARGVRSAYRRVGNVGDRSGDFGFRCARLLD
jgi:formylglycine-generating enzyme required for sulfatase activity